MSKILIDNWKQGWKFISTWCHLAGLIFSGIGTGLALAYSSMDRIQHSLLPTWLTYAIIFVIFLSAFIGRFLKQ